MRKQSKPHFASMSKMFPSKLQKHVTYWGDLKNSFSKCYTANVSFPLCWTRDSVNFHLAVPCTAGFMLQASQILQKEMLWWHFTVKVSFFIPILKKATKSFETTSSKHNKHYMMLITVHVHMTNCIISYWGSLHESADSDQCGSM